MLAASGGTYWWLRWPTEATNKWCEDVGTMFKLCIYTYMTACNHRGLPRSPQIKRIQPSQGQENRICSGHSGCQNASSGFRWKKIHWNWTHLFRTLTWVAGNPPFWNGWILFFHGDSPGYIYQKWRFSMVQPLKLGMFNEPPKTLDFLQSLRYFQNRSDITSEVPRGRLAASCSPGATLNPPWPVPGAPARRRRRRSRSPAWRARRRREERYPKLVPGSEPREQCQLPGFMHHSILNIPYIIYIYI